MFFHKENQKIILQKLQIKSFADLSLKSALIRLIFTTNLFSNFEI